jgi:hypothetical protein
MDKQLYIGQKAVTETNEKDEKVQYTLADGTQDTVRKEQFEKMAKEEPYDEGLVRVYKWSPAVFEIIGVLLKYDSRIAENGFILDRVENSVAENYKAGIAKMLGIDYEHNVRMSDVHKILKSE